MSTVGSYRGVDELLARLDRVRSRQWLAHVLAGLAGVVAVAAMVVGLWGASLGYWPDQPPTTLRWAMLLGGALAAAAAVGWLLARPLLGRMNALQTARYVERALPQLRNDLINSLQLASSSSPSPAITQAAIDEALAASKSVDLRASIDTGGLKRALVAASVAIAAVAGFALAQPGPFGRGVMAVWQPGRYVMANNSLERVTLEPRDATVFVNQPVRFRVEVDNPPAAPLTGQVVIKGRAHPLPLLADVDYRTFTAELPRATESFRYAVRLGDSRWPTDRPWYEIRVVDRVSVEGMDLTYRYPAYTRRPPRTVTNAAGPVRAPYGTHVAVTVRLGSRAPAMLLERRNLPPVPMERSDDGRTFTGQFQVDTPGGYRIVILDETGQPLQRLPDASDAASPAAAPGGYWPIEPVADAPPQVSFLAPNRDVTVAPAGKLELRIRVADDFGLSSVQLQAGPEPAGQREPVLQPVSGFDAGPLEGESARVIPFTLDLSKVPADLGEGDVLVYRAEVADNRQPVVEGLGGPQWARTALFRVLIQDPAKLAAAKARRYDQLRKMLLAMLELQLAQRLETGLAATEHATLAQVTTAGKAIHAAQSRLRADMVSMVSEFPFDAEMVAIQQALAMLANNEARQAVAQSDVLANLTDFAARKPACTPLAGTQDQIIQTLQTLLAILPSLANRPEATPSGPDDTDLPPAQAQKLRQLRDQVKQFAEQQKKAIQTTRDLAKKPADTFTAEDDKTLTELIANADKWEKFLNEKFADLSKLATQDFSNPVMLKELISVKCDVTMAKNALEKKAIEIATAAEDNGLENAESLTANIEKWLPDEPDRKKWNMEDPAAGQENIEAAELPTELEDLVGDLLEEEEDLFEEMQDLSSKATMSGDKGIGWDANDGPISNMNAQGVTGNQLPNASEISGRSGEGRTGKSGGEFVEDKAVGKGGRRTPTRLTAEPFQKGQVNDQSTDPAGGATGGGKLSSAGGEGMEGPVPPEIKKEMPRLAARQASLVNRAERIQARFQPTDYTNFRMLQAIILMKRVESDLRKGNYANALRTNRDAVAALRQSKLMLSGHVDVSADTTAAMPKYVRDDIADAMGEKLPPEYKDAMEAFYQRLSE